jgi:hypothetical protein
MRLNGQTRARQLQLTVSLVVAAALSAGISATAFASAGPKAVKARAERPAPRMLAAGQVGTRSEVPWRKVGSGWALAQYTQGTVTAAKPLKLYLIDPSGGKYLLYTWRASQNPWELIGWSGDKTRALFGRDSTGTQTVRQLALATGCLMQPFRLPAKVAAIGYTSPDGKNILATDDGLVSYNLRGKFQARLIKGNEHDVALSAPDGISYVVSSGAGVDLVSNRGSIIRSLPVPGTDAKLGGCTPVRWWKPSTALVTCTPKSDAVRLWLVPVSGAAPRPLQRHLKKPNLGYLDAWRMQSGLYVLAGCGSCQAAFLAYIGKLAANGAVRPVEVPGNVNSNFVVATSGTRMLVWEASDCCGQDSPLVWFNPATRAVQTVLSARPDELGVILVVPYNREQNG